MVAVGASICGNDVVEGAEQCDAIDLANQTCLTLGEGFTGGTLACQSTCRFDRSGCF